MRCKNVCSKIAVSHNAIHTALVEELETYLLMPCHNGLKLKLSLLVFPWKKNMLHRRTNLVVTNCKPILTNTFLH